MLYLRISGGCGLFSWIMRWIFLDMSVALFGSRLMNYENESDQSLLAKHFPRLPFGSIAKSIKEQLAQSGFTGIPSARSGLVSGKDHVAASGCLESKCILHLTSWPHATTSASLTHNRANQQETPIADITLCFRYPHNLQPRESSPVRGLLGCCRQNAPLMRGWLSPLPASINTCAVRNKNSK
jgi:hypothetical protein